MNLSLIMAEFGAERQNAGGATLPNRLEPTLSSMRKFFPEIKLEVYSDQDLDLPSDAVLHIVAPPFDRNHHRYGWRCNDFYSVYGLLKSQADVAIAMDSDMLVISEEVRSLIPLAQKFGLCLPVNGRWMAKKDAASTCDGAPIDDESRGNGLAYAATPIAMKPKSFNAMLLASAYCQIMEENPVRGPLAWWRAVWRTGIVPYALPPQWCVCAGQEGIGSEIILHVGHPSVATFYDQHVDAT